MLQETNASTSHFTDGRLELSRTDEQREARAALTDDLLSRPLSESDAVRVALANSPAVQALLAQGWADMAAANQSGRLPNPLFKFERLRLGDELELGRLLSFGLVDLILLPQRMALSKSQSAQVKVQLASAVVDQVTQVRQAWVRAVAAQQSLQYAVQVNEAAQASAEFLRSPMWCEQNTCRPLVSAMVDFSSAPQARTAFGLGHGTAIGAGAYPRLRRTGYGAPP